MVRWENWWACSAPPAINRIQKVLEGANIKLSSVASSVVGVSGRAMLEALISGQEDPEALASLAKGRLRAKRAQLEQALRGVMGTHQRILLMSLLRHLDFLGDEVATMDREIAQRMQPGEDAIQRVDAILGVGQRTAEELQPKRMIGTVLDMTTMKRSSLLWILD